MVRLTFLGTGGGRFATTTQARATGGLYIEDGASKLHVDPGPGALLRMLEHGLDPARTTAILVTHAHLDHANDASILIEAMTKGGLEKRGFLLASRSVLDGADGLGPVVSAHHRGLVAGVELAEAGATYRLSGHTIHAGPTDHSDKTTVAFRIGTSAGDVSYFTDSVFRPDLVEPHAGARVLVLGVTRPRGTRIPNHLATEDAVEVARITKPELLVMTHLGLKVLRQGPEAEAASIEKETGVRTVAARDGMQVFLRPDGIGLGQARRGGHQRGRDRSGRRPPHDAPGAAGGPPE